MLKDVGPSERIFNEIKKIEDLDFAYQEEKFANDNVETLCENMVFYPPEHYLDGDSLLFEYDEKLLRDCQNALSRDNVNVFLRSKEINQETLDLTEPWFGTRYSKSDIPSDWLRETDEYRGEFHLPVPNNFIAEDTALIKLGDDVESVPVRILSEKSGELYYKADNTFKQPRAYIAYLLRSPLQLESTSNACLLDLLVMCLLQNMTEDVYPADLAQLGYSLYAHESGMVIKVNGLSDKLAKLLEVIIDHLVKFEDETNQEIFEAVLDQQKRNYYNHCIKAKKLVRDVRLSLLQDVYHSPHQKHNIIGSLTLSQLKEFASKFKSHLTLQALVQGNMTQAAAEDVDKFVKTRLDCSSYPDPGAGDIRCVELGRGEAAVRVDSLHQGDSNTLVTNYYQHGPGTIRDQAIIETIVLLMEEPIFDTLRTQEQLGYAVSMCMRNTYGVLGLSVTVNTQATKFTPQHVDQRIENFFKSFIADSLNEEAVQKAVQSLIKLKVQYLVIES